MAIEWAALAAGAALDIVLGATASGARKKFDKILSDGPLAAPLRHAFIEAFTGFYKSLEDGLTFTISNEEALAKLPGTVAFRDAAAQLPYVPFRKIDVEPLRREFLAIGIKDADETDFAAAWKALGRRFEATVAESEPLKNFVDLAYSTRAEERDEKLLALVERLVALHEKAAGVPDPSPVLRAYRQAFYRQYRYADTRGLFMREKEGVGEGIELRDVFVETRLAPLKVRVKKDSGEDAEPLPSTEPQRLGDILARERSLVVLGPPGCGKSTLLRCLALTLCRPEGDPPIVGHSLPPEAVPVLLPLREFASELKADPNMSLERFLFDLFKDAIPGLEQLLREGRALVLLDGLDEVFEEGHRRWVSDQVWALTSRFERSWFVLTSRPHGYEAAPLPGPVSRWQLLAFDEDQIGRFFHGWFQALAREGGEAGLEEAPETRAAALTQEVLSRDRLKEMAQNPLLCTLIVLVHRSRSGRLPERRVVFYEAAVRTLAEAWERMKRHPGQEKLDFPEPEILIRALAEVAWRAFHQLASREIPGPELRAWLREYLEREPEWRGERGERAVRDFLNLAGQRTGLLVDLGGDRYQFVHLSLHEWLVAHFLLDRLTEAQRWEVFRHYLHAAEWEEVLRLLVGGAPQAQADLLVSRLLGDPTHEMEDELRRDLRFVCRCLDDQAPVGPEVRKEVLRRTLQALDDPELPEPFGFLSDLTGLGQSPELVSRIRKYLESPEPELRLAAAGYFFVQNVEDESVRRELVKQLGDPDSSIRELAMVYLVRSGNKDEATRQAFLERLGDDVYFLRNMAVDYFVQLGPGDAGIRRMFLEGLRHEQPGIRSSALRYFSESGVMDGEVRKAVVERLADPDIWVRSLAVELLAQPGAVEESVRRELFDLWRSDNETARASVTDLFSRLGAGDEEVREAMWASLEEASAYVYLPAIRYFAHLGKDEEVFRRFLGDLQGKDARKPHLALTYFTELGSRDEEVLLAVRKKLTDPASWSARRGAVEYFTVVGIDDEETRRAVLEGLNDEDTSVRVSAANYFRRMGIVDDTTLGRMLERLEEEEQPLVKEGILKYLGAWAPDTEDTRRRILSCLTDPNDWVRRSAMDAFVELGVETAEAVQAAMERLEDKDAQVRTSAAEYLARLGPADEKVRRALLGKVEVDPRLWGAVVRYFLRTGLDPEAGQKLLDLLKALSHVTPLEEDLRFSEELGKQMAHDEALRQRALAEGRDISGLDLSSALRTFALEQDRLRRGSKPLSLPGIPGC